jgi:dienelactone hydrolase
MWGNGVAFSQVPNSYNNVYGQRIIMLQMEWVEKLLPYAKSLGATTFAAVGNCWGGYMVMRLSSYTEFKAG